MSFVTRGLGGPSHNINTGGLGGILSALIGDQGTGTGGLTKQTYEIAARKIWIRKPGPPAIRLEDVFPPEEIVAPVTVEVEGIEFELKIGKRPTAAEALKSVPGKILEKKIQAAMKELDVTRKVARKALIKRAAIELRAAKDFKESLVLDDEEFYLLLFMEEA